jgi:hypothetical protein
MRTFGLAFANMWGHSSDFRADYLLDCFPCLRGHYQFELTQSPELAFFSVYGYIQDRYDGAIRLVYAGEAGDHMAQGGKISPGVCEQGFYHFGITCAAEQSSLNHCYMPAGLLHLNLYKRGVSTLIRQPGEAAARKKFFCNFIYSNGNSRDRIEFFHTSDFKSDEESIEYINAVDQNDALYQTYLDAPPFVGNVVPAKFTDEHYLNFWQKILR